MLIVDPGCSRRGPSAVYGTADPILGSGFTESVSDSFATRETEALFGRLNSVAFRQALAKYTCGRVPPAIVFTVSLWPKGQYQERQILIQPRPEPDSTGSGRCLSFGLSFLAESEISRLDHGTPINYHYRSPFTGRELPASAYARSKPIEPLCDCSQQFTGKEWVTFNPRPNAQ